MYAAGLTIAEDKYLDFKSAFEKVVQQTMQEEWREQEIEIDAVIDIDEISDKTYRILKQFEPFGPENMHPLFLSKNVFLDSEAKTIGKTKEHITAVVTQSGHKKYKAIGFNLAQKIAILNSKQPFDAVYSLEENEFKGHVSLQLRLRDIKTSTN
jgi:single-stranded-DNA-specific exonuclease